MITNKYLDEVFKELKIEGEEYFYYFYVYNLPKTEVYMMNGILPIGDIEHIIVCFTNKRLMFLEVTMMGKLTGNTTIIDLDTLDKIKVKRGMIRTSIIVTPKETQKDMTIKANSFTFGLSNQKKNLKELAKLYS
ncbi:hypothetical protein COF68_05610 [Bacillus toyonensis]|uniref:PH domain-containing protein n=1 Tax=Bacillus toyonensis TaxID=155322 RepID=UPI000BFC55FB|nr:PH domain-containing protein [Bacillus toyonensis]PHE64319.1 hypothetical protein COF68_05610 [Bacillus toyonensis]